MTHTYNEIGFLLPAAVSALAAGFVNALAGGGTLITFPVLTALGMPPVMANVTNTVALCPGYLGGIAAQLADLRHFRSSLPALVFLSLAGGVLGAWLLLLGGDKIFPWLVPWLLVFASLLLLLQPVIKKGLPQGKKKAMAMAGFILPAAVYGGYFGAGLSVIVIAVLGFSFSEPIGRLNALKQTVSLTVNLSAALFFGLSGPVQWIVAGTMALFALAGGWIGGKAAGKMNPGILRIIMVSFGIAVAAWYFYKVYFL